MQIKLPEAFFIENDDNLTLAFAADYVILPDVTRSGYYEVGEDIVIKNLTGLLNNLSGE